MAARDAQSQAHSILVICMLIMEIVGLGIIGTFPISRPGSTRCGMHAWLSRLGSRNSQHQTLPLAQKINCETRVPAPTP